MVQIDYIEAYNATEESQNLFVCSLCGVRQTGHFSIVNSDIICNSCLYDRAFPRAIDRLQKHINTTEKMLYAAVRKRNQKEIEQQQHSLSDSIENWFPAMVREVQP